jgi:hypothetical protein
MIYVAITSSSKKFGYSSIEVSQLDNLDPPDPPLSQMVVCHGRSSLSSTIHKLSLGNSSETDIFETLS